MKNTNIIIDGKSLKVPSNFSVLDAINKNKQYISQLCKDEDMNALGACRTCLVEIEGIRGLPASCSVPVSEGMNIKTKGENLDKIRNNVLSLTSGMLSKNKSGKDYKDLSTALNYYSADKNKFIPRERSKADTSNTVFDISMEDCILCGRCTTGCQEGAQFIGAIDMLGTGNDTRIGTFNDEPLVDSVCTTCGQCLSVCPTGAIKKKPDPVEIAKSVTTTCPYCGVGCGINIELDKNDNMINVSDDPTNKSSLGMLCIKGRFGYRFVQHKDRIKTPLIKKDGIFVESSWDEAIDLIADKFSGYVGNSFATLCSAKATNEDGYIQQKFSRVVMQSNNIDHCTRLCHSPSVEAMLKSLGSGATSNSYIDYEESGCLIIAGSDANSNHPVAASRMRRAVIEKGAKLIIINPRRIEMCDYADLWLRPKPGTDVALLNGIAKSILDQKLENTQFIESRTEGYEEWKKIIDDYTPEKVESITGVKSEDIIQAAKFYAKPKFGGSCLIWGMGITQHTNGTANAHSLLNLSLVTGELGKPGSGISPLRGQNNVQGCGDAGCLPNSFSGYQVIDDNTVKKFNNAWQTERIPTTHGYVVTDMVKKIEEGIVKAMYITGENPLLSEPDLNHAEKTFKKLEFLVVQDLFLHETAQIADVVLPAASFAEKDGTFTNSERRVQRVRAAISPIGKSKPDWEIIQLIANKVAEKLSLELNSQFAYNSPSEIWEEMAKLTPSISGINYERLENEGGIQWPCPDTNHPGTRYLYETDFPRGDRAKFFGYSQGRRADEMPNKKYPLTLITGRILYHWHGGTMTTRSEYLLSKASELEVSINPHDSNKFGINDGDWISVESKRGKLEARAYVTDKMSNGEIFVPFVKLQNHAANFLTNPAVDPESKIPEYKVCAVKIGKI
tara:strand:+ start:550 stop:3249 length:2700 start_codon:yes stop_codon:yes gene_type:complete